MVNTREDSLVMTFRSGEIFWYNRETEDFLSFLQCPDLRIKYFSGARRIFFVGTAVRR